MMGRFSAPLHARGIGLHAAQPVFALEVSENATVFPRLLVGRPDEMVETFPHALPAPEGYQDGRLDQVAHFSRHDPHRH